MGNGKLCPIEIKKVASPGKDAVKHFKVLQPVSEPECFGTLEQHKLEIGHSAVICMVGVGIFFTLPMFIFSVLSLSFIFRHLFPSRSFCQFLFYLLLLQKFDRIHCLALPTTSTCFFILLTRNKINCNITVRLAL